MIQKEVVTFLPQLSLFFHFVTNEGVFFSIMLRIESNLFVPLHLHNTDKEICLAKLTE